MYDKIIGSSIPLEGLVPFSFQQTQTAANLRSCRCYRGTGRTETTEGEVLVGSSKDGLGRRAWNTHRHAEQQRSIVGHMEKKNMLDRRFVYIEMGAGRGTLSLTLREAEARCDVVLVERRSQRFKTDSKIIDRQPFSSGVWVWVALSCFSSSSH